MKKALRPLKKLVTNEKEPKREDQQKKEEKQIKILPDLQKNLDYIKKKFEGCSDLIIREFMIGDNTNAVVIFIDGLSDKGFIQEHVLKSLNLEARQTEPKIIKEEVPGFIEHHALTMAEVKIIENMDDCISGFLSGDASLLIDGWGKGYLLGAKGWATRGISEPDSESLVRGPKEGFTETMRINTSMVRRRLRSSDLKIEARKVGKKTQTDITILYMDGIINPKILGELHKRLDKISEVDAILESGCIEQYIEDSPFSPFPQIQYTERPDKVVAYLLEGRAVIMIDGTPNCLIVPTVFVQFLQSPEDYYERMLVSTLVRWIRFIGVFSAITLPALYIAITTFHQEMIPTQLALNIAGAREGVPFPAFIEAFLMEIALELLREATVRLPGAIGGTIGIVGALIVGQAAVEAGLVAPQMVIVVALTAIGSFTIPSISAAIPFRLIRIPLMILGALLGLYGVILGCIAILIHMISLKSFGYPYLEPLAPLRVSELKDVFIRAPRWQMMTAPQFRKPKEKPPQSMFSREYLKEDKSKKGEEDE